MPFCVFSATYAATLLTALLCSPKNSQSENLEAKQIYQGALCTGYSPDARVWKDRGIAGFLSTEDQCPDGYAYVANQKPKGPIRDGKLVAVNGTCCPLPPDALLDEHRLVERECPAGFVATGGKSTADFQDCQDWRACGKKWLFTDQYMRCTRINTKRYQLGEADSGMRWGWNRTLGEWLRPHTTKAVIPLSLRHGLGRMDRMLWAVEGCVAYPWGSLLVEKSGPRCRDLYYSQLQYRGLAEDPPKGTPVRILAECDSISDRFDPNARCISSRSTSSSGISRSGITIQASVTAAAKN